MGEGGRYKESPTSDLLTDPAIPSAVGSNAGTASIYRTRGIEHQEPTCKATRDVTPNYAQ